MSPHLSDLALDELVADGRRPPHLEECEQCRARAEVRLSAARDLRARTDFAQARARAMGAAIDPRPPRARWLLPGFALAAAMAVALVIRVPRGDLGATVRTKGRVSVELIQVAAERAGSELREGDSVALKLDGGSHRLGLVVSVDRSGKVEALWPLGATSSGALQPAGPSQVFRVTAGDFAVHAFYSDAPLSLPELAARFAALPERCRVPQDPRDCAEEYPPLPDVDRASLSVRVKAR
jgi:hypothetical protein